MVAVHGSKARLYANGWDMTDFMREATLAGSADAADASTWGLGSKKYVAGRQDATLSGSGVYDGLAGGAVAVLEAALGSAGSVIYLPQGEGFGKIAKVISATYSGFEIDTPGDDVGGFTFEVQSSSGAGGGRVLRGLTGALDINANGSGTSLDGLAATAAGGLAALQIVNKGGGAGTLTVSIEDSANDADWAVIAAFAGKTSAHQQEVVAVVGAVRRYLRAVWTVTGGTWDFAAAFARRLS